MKGRQRMKLTTTRIIDILLIAICTAALIYFHLAKADRGQKPGYRLITSTTPAMIEEMDYTIRKGRLLAATAWEPHWMNDKLNIKYLKDPRKIFGETENVYTVVRKGFTKDHPEIAKFFHQFKWKTSDLNSLSLICYGYDGDFEKGAREWLRKNPALKAAFLKDIKPAPGTKIKMVDIGFYNELATNAMLKILLTEHLKCEVSNVSTTIPIAFEALANGTQDVMVTVWLPNYHKREYAAIQDRVENLGANMEGARMGIIVPKYAPVDSIEDLAEYGKEFGGKIMGIEPGQGIMVLTEKAIEEYGLK